MKYSQLTENKHQYEFKHKYSIEISIVKRRNTWESVSPALFVQFTFVFHQ